MRLTLVLVHWIFETNGLKSNSPTYMTIQASLGYMKGRYSTNLNNPSDNK